MKKHWRLFIRNYRTNWKRYRVWLWFYSEVVSLVVAVGRRRYSINFGIQVVALTLAYVLLFAGCTHPTEQAKDQVSAQHTVTFVYSTGERMDAPSTGSGEFTIVPLPDRYPDLIVVDAGTDREIDIQVKRSQ
jgi:hypothetical protein